MPSFSPFLFFSLHNNSTSTASTMIEFRLNVTLRCLVLRMGNNLMNAVYVFYANSCHVCYYLFRYFTPTHSREIERGSKACFTTVSTHERRRHYFFIRILNFPFLFLSLPILANGSQCLRARLLFIVRSANETTGECFSECLQESRLRN